jgi:hypothetical protein
MKVKTPRFLISLVIWRDAAFSFLNELPETEPTLRYTFGILLRQDDEDVFISTNIAFDESKLEILPVDGFHIPPGTIENIIHIKHESSRR